MQLPKLLLIAGNGRNIGKTTLACEIIDHFRHQTAIIGLKVTAVYPDENEFHGKKDISLEVPYDIYEEKTLESYKDTARMLHSGAKRVFYIRCRDTHIQEAMLEFFEIIGSESVVVCESGSLRKVAVPGLFIYLENPKNQSDKDKNREVKNLASKIIETEFFSSGFQISEIELNPAGWHFAKLF